MRFLCFILMLFLSIPDIFLAFYNLSLCFVLYLVGFIFKSKKIKMYARNIALSVDQFIATKAMGQDPDVSISMALGVAKVKKESGVADVSHFWILFGCFVDWLFFFEKDHIINAIEKEEKASYTIIKLYKEKK